MLYRINQKNKVDTLSVERIKTRKVKPENEKQNKLNKLEAFATQFGAQFYGLSLNTTQTITLIKQNNIIPEQLPLTKQDNVVPFMAGQTLTWCTT